METLLTEPYPKAVSAARQAQTTPLSTREIPYPYQALLAICSDLDETPSAEVYFQLSKFLNTTEMTSSGEGVGLEVGNTLFFDMPSSSFSYWNATEADREKLVALMKSGHIDCIHSFGDTATTRQDAERSIEELVRRGCKLSVWVDHAQAVTNFGSDIMKGRGDCHGDKAYHADLTAKYGIKYVWRGRVTSLIGQNKSRRFHWIWNYQHPVKSSITTAKELCKFLIPEVVSSKYALNRRNSLLQPCVLRDGTKMMEFLRCNPHWGGVSYADRGYQYDEVLTRNFLTRLCETGGVSILYAHLGKLNKGEGCFPRKVVEAFRLLRSFVDKNQILTLSTKRLLDYMMQGSFYRPYWVTDQDGDKIEIFRSSTYANAQDLPSLEGLTIYIKKFLKVPVFFEGKILKTELNPPDETGQPSITVKFSKLTYPY